MTDPHLQMKNVDFQTNHISETKYNRYRLLYKIDLKFNVEFNN